MNLKQLFLMLTLLVALGTTMFAQNTIYVDVTNGSDTYTGANATNNPAGTGPKATFAAGVAALANVANGGTIIIKAGTYAEALDFTTGLPANVTSYTIQLTQLNANNDVAFTGGASVINKTGLTVTITQSVGTEKITQTSTTLNMTLGTINLGTSAAWVLPTGTTINLAGASGFSNAAPSKTTNISLNYTGGSTITAGQESNYGSFGTGTITVAKTAGTGVTFPNAITAVGGITITSGNATFDGAVTVSAGATDVVNNGTGTLTFNGAVTLGPLVTGAALDANIASIENTSSGSIVNNSTTTFSVPTTLAAAAFAQGAGTDAILNSGTGSLLLNGAVTLNAPNNTTGNDYSFFAENTSTGTLTIGTVSTPSSGAANFEGTLNLAGAATAGTINVSGGTYANTVTVLAGHTLNVNGATTVGGVFTNAGTTALGANALTLSGNVAHVTVGGTVTATAPGGIFVTSTGAGISFNGGTLGNLTNNGAGNTVALSAVTTFTNVTATAGTITVGAASTIGGTLTLNGGNVTNGNFTITVTNYEQSSGTFTLAANAASILDVNGNFNRTGGTFTAGAGSLVGFTGSGAQTVNGGPLFQVSALTFNNAGGTITVGNSIRASGAIIIATATNVDFSTTNLIMNGGAATSTITNNGTYTAIGGGGVVVGGVNTVTGGVAGGALAATYTLQGTGTYSYITVDVGVGNFAEVVTTVTGVKWNGVLTLRSGTLNVTTAGVDFGPTGSSASIIRYPQDSPGIAVTGGTFNTANVSYDLTYTGTLTADQAVGGEITTTPANVKTWTVMTTGAFNNDLPANGLTFGGTLTIENGATVRIPTDGGGADYFTLSGASKNHIIRGTFDVQAGDADALRVTGASSTITGSATVAHAATIDDVEFNATGIVVTDIQLFSGTVTTGASSTVTLGMGAAAAEQVITDLLTVGGTSFTLTTPVTINNGAAHTAGTIDIGANTITMATGGNWLQTGGSFASTGGYLQFNVAGSLTLTSAMPYLRANDVAITLGSNVTISQNLDITDPAGGAAGTITSAGFNVTIPNSLTTVGGAVFTGGGAIVLTGTTVTASGNPTITNLTVNSTGIATLASSVAATARTFTVTGVLTHTAGELALGINHVALTGAGAAYTRAAGTITATTGELQFAGTAAQTAAQGTGFSVPNLTINNSTAGTPDVTFAGGATNDFTVTGTLKLSQGDLSSTTAGKLHLANGATISRVADFSLLSQVPTFDGDVNLVYTTFNGVAPIVAAMANEVPTAASGKLNNVTVAVGATNTLNTAAATTFKGTATLTSGTWGNAGGAITVASGATVVKNAGAFGATPTVTNYNLTYTSTQTTTTTEFRNGTGISVDLLTINGAGITVTLGQNRTVKNFTLTAGTFADGAFTLTVLGDMNLAGGTYTGTGALELSGTTAQTITVPAAGLTFGGNLTLNNAAGFTLAGGNFTMGAGKLVTFTAGVLSTGANRFTLAHTVAGQGFTRTSGHIMGNVAQNITAGAGTATYANGRYEFPVGNATDYRPYMITFSGAYPAINPTTVIVNHVDSSPEGTKNFPLDAGNGLTIGNYPSYYWLVKTTPSSFTSTQLFDVEMHATNIGYPYDSDQNLRIIRRQDGSSESNGWSLQGNSTNYANYQVVTGSDTLAVIRTTATLGGIVNEGTRFTAGVPSQGPIFTMPVVTDYVMNEGATENIDVAAISREIGTAISSITKVSGPAFATYTVATTSTGTLSLAPGYTDGTADYTVVLRATDARGLTTDLTIAVTVNNVNRAVEFTAELTGTVTARAGDEFSFQYEALDEDSDPLTFFLEATTGDAISNAATVSESGLLTWTPAAEDIGKTVSFQVGVTDGTDTVYSVVGSVTIIDNNAPVFTAVMENQTVVYPNPISFTYEATDADGDELTFAFNGEVPEGAAIDASTGEFTWTPKFNQTAIYLIKVKVTDTHGGVATTVAEVTVTEDPNIVGVDGLGIPTEFALEQNYPNPFNPSTVIRFGLPEQSNVTLRVYNILGQEVATLLNTVKAAGWHEVNFNAANLNSGLYIYRIEAKDFVSIKKMVFVK